MAVAEFVVSFREFFEICAVLAVMLAYLHKTGNGKHAKYVWAGAALAALASIAASVAFDGMAQWFEANEALFEGITLVLACAFVTWLIFWMFGQKNAADGIREGVRHGIAGGNGIPLAMFAFVAVLREGIEIVLFFAGIKIVSGSLNLLWATGGALAAILLAYAAYSHLVRLDMGKFFTITGTVLVLMAGGLLGQGVHELQEAGVLPEIVEHVYDFNPPVNADGSYPTFHEKGILGGTLKTIAGYDANPSLLQLASQLGYYAFAYASYRRICGQRH